MSGIREPKKDGGSMSQLVKPNNDGSRPGYAGPLAIPAFMGLNALRTGAMALGRRAIPKIANFFRTQVGSKGPGSVKIPGEAGTAGRFLPKNVRTVPKSGPSQPIYEPNYLGRDPLVQLAGGTFKAITNPKVAGVAGKVARFATSPSSIIAGTAYYLWPDGKERTTPPPLGDSGRRGTSGAPGGGDPGMILTPQAKGGQQDPSLSTKSAEELRAKKVQEYRDIMDIKGMNKTAAYNSLIAASQLINQEGDFKGSIKDGSLISKLIGATSKAFDKPSQTKDAINTLILKGEIDKDIKASDPSNAVLNELRAGQLRKLNKDLKGNTTAEIIQARMLKDDMPSGSNLASLISINNPELNVKVLPTKDLGNADPIDYMTKIVATVNADETTPDYPAGVYVLKDKVIQITEEGAVVPVPINALK
jgi:hypothetical protein